MQFINGIRIEWLKTRRSAASWLCLVGGFFLPLMSFIGFLKDHKSIDNFTGATNSWLVYFVHLREFLVIALLPMGIILVTSLITQVEYRNNSWKLVHTMPRTWLHTFSTKLAVLLLMVFKFFIFFNAGMLLAAVLPTLLFNHSLPRDPLPVLQLLRANLHIFVVCLPVIALQYLFSLYFRNFLVPLGLGLLLWIGSLILVQHWSYAWISPYSYTTLLTQPKANTAGRNIFALALVYFPLITLTSFVLYYSKKDKS